MDVEPVRSQILELIQRPRSHAGAAPFVFSSTLNGAANPGLDIPDHGIIGLPLSKTDAEVIKAHAMRSPFGKGEDTLVDLNVRKSWELNPSQFVLKNPQWQSTVRTAVQAAYHGLNLQFGVENVEAQLYKLLLYEEGAFFKPHKDSEKAPGMFGTMVIALPSKHEGGTLMFNHGKRQVEFDTSASSEFGTSLAAWYADVTHQVLPVASGFRLMLTYNLIKKGTFPMITLAAMSDPDYHPMEAVLCQYNAMLKVAEADAPPFFIHKLQYQYSDSSIHPQALKGEDVSQWNSLQQVAKRLGFALYLATLERQIDKDDESEEEVDRIDKLKHIVDINGKCCGEEMEVPEGCILDEESFDEDDADDEEHEGWTGNEGSPATYWYRDAAIVIVPAAGKLMFAYLCDSTEAVSDFHTLKSEMESDEDKKGQVLQFCRGVLQKSPAHSEWVMSSHPISGITPEGRDQWLPEVLTTVIDLDRCDLLGNVFRTELVSMMLSLGSYFGRALARQGLSKLQSLFTRIVTSTSDFPTKAFFFNDVRLALEASKPEPSSQLVDTFKDFYGVLLANETLKKGQMRSTDGSIAAEHAEILSDGVFISSFLPVINQAPITVRVTFANYYTNAKLASVSEKRKEAILASRAKTFQDLSFPALLQPEPQGYPYYNSSFSRYGVSSGKDDSMPHDVLWDFLSHTAKLLPPAPDFVWKCLTTVVKKSETLALSRTVVPFIRMMADKDIPELTRADNGAHPEWLNFLRVSLTRYITEYVGPRPRQPSDWRKSPKPCSCRDCSIVNAFLVDPGRWTLDFPAAENRRRHLSSTFNDYHQMSFTVDTIRTGSPLTWRITKVHGEHQKNLREWNQRFLAAEPQLDELYKSDNMRRMLGDAALDEIMYKRHGFKPSNRKPLQATSGNLQATSPKKRSPQDMIGEEDDGPAKRLRSADENGDVDGPAKHLRSAENATTEQPEVVDLTELD